MWMAPSAARERVKPVAARDDVVVAVPTTGMPEVVVMSAETGLERWRRGGSIAHVGSDELVAWPIPVERNGQPVVSVLVTIPPGGTIPPLPPPSDLTTTVEVWSLTDGSLLREFEIPEGAGFYGSPSMTQTQGRLDELAFVGGEESMFVDAVSGDTPWSLDAPPSSLLAADDRVVVTADGAAASPSSTRAPATCGGTPASRAST